MPLSNQTTLIRCEENKTSSKVTGSDATSMENLCVLYFDEGVLHVSDFKWILGFLSWISFFSLTKKNMGRGQSFHRSPKAEDVMLPIVGQIFIAVRCIDDTLVNFFAWVEDSFGNLGILN